MEKIPKAMCLSLSLSLFNKKMLPQNRVGWRSGSLKNTGRIWSILPRSCGNALRASASFGYPVLLREIWQPPQDSHRRRQFGGWLRVWGAWEIRVALNHPWESEWAWSILFTSFHVFSCISVLHVLHAKKASYLWLSNVRFFFTPPRFFGPFLKMDVRSDWESWGLQGNQLRGWAPRTWIR